MCVKWYIDWILSFQQCNQHPPRFLERRMLLVCGGGVVWDDLLPRGCWPSCVTRESQWENSAVLSTLAQYIHSHNNIHSAKISMAWWIFWTHGCWKAEYLGCDVVGFQGSTFSLALGCHPSCVTLLLQGKNRRLPNLNPYSSSHSFPQHLLCNFFEYVEFIDCFDGMIWRCQADFINI